MAEKTKICCLDVDEEILSYLKKDHEVYPGSLGKKVSLPEKSNRLLRVLPNYNFPPNIQEYDVFIIDMREGESVDYSPEDYVPTYNETGDDNQIICVNNVTLFNPIPYGASRFYRSLQNKRDKRPIIIVFQGEYVKRQYRWGDRNGYLKGQEEHTNYGFTYIPIEGNLYGTHVDLVENDASEVLFKDRLKGIQTHCVFDCLKRNEFMPLLVNKNGQCVSYVEVSGNDIVIMLPQMQNKKEFIAHLFDDYLYECLSEYFPYVEEKRWIHKAEYMLPNEVAMVKELEDLEHEYAEKKEAIVQRMTENIEEYDFLHTLITGTGDKLVDAVIKYLEWLGFDNVEDVDEIGNELKEEDIRIPIPNGLFILEVKGIRHHSTDKECEQVGKYKARRMEDLDTRNIKALYVVNHERNIEPLTRQNPPFQEKQISDAFVGRRGLVTTWQLFNLYYDIENGILSRDDARDALMEYGLVSFVPKGAIKIGVPYKEYSGNVICVEIDGQEVSIGDELYAFDGQHWHKAIVLSIREDTEDLECVSKGRFGFKTSQQLPSKVDVYVRHNKE